MSLPLILQPGEGRSVQIRTSDGRQPSQEELLELMQKFDQYPVP